VKNKFINQFAESTWVTSSNEQKW